MTNTLYIAFTVLLSLRNNRNVDIVYVVIEKTTQNFPPVHETLLNVV